MTIAIIGGGAAGLMAAATLCEQAPDVRVILLEKNDGLGKKVIISGGGRCNVTTGLRDLREVLKRYPRGNKFLLSAFHQFPPEAVYAWFEAHGVPLKIEEDLRAFPQSDDGHDIVAVFERLFRRGNVEVRLKANVIRLEKTPIGFHLFLKDRPEPLVADRVILTTGGQAYRHTGSTGDGYAFAQAMGHTLMPLAPSLNAFFTKETWPAELAGLSFGRATVTAHRGKGHAYTGPFLFTHKGITGPAVFAVSSLVAFEKYDLQQPLRVTLDLFPDEAADALRAGIEASLRANGRKALATVLGFVVPKSLATLLCQQAGVPEHKNAADVNKQELARIVAWLKAVPLDVTGRGAGDEFVTAGGIPLTEVNPSTMESKITPGLFFAGEILDIDGFTGGFNLQASWATGRLAGRGAFVR